MSKSGNTNQGSAFGSFLEAFGNQPASSRIFGIVFLVVFLPCALIGFLAAWISTKVGPKVPLWCLVLAGIVLVGTPLVFIEFIPFEKTSKIISLVISFFLSFLFARAALLIFAPNESGSNTEKQ